MSGLFRAAYRVDIAGIYYDTHVYICVYNTLKT